MAFRLRPVFTGLGFQHIQKGYSFIFATRKYKIYKQNKNVISIFFIK